MNTQYSIVATTYNDERVIERYLIEMISQTVKPTEIVIADGGSTDNTVSIAEAFKKKCEIPIRVIYGRRLNIAQGYNEAIKNTNTELVGVTGLGNHYTKDFFERLLDVFNSKENDGVYPPIRGYESNVFSKLYNNTFLNGKAGQRLSIASNHGVLLKKQIFDEVGYFYEEFVYAGEDTEYYLWIKKQGYQLELVPDAYVYWETPINMSEFKKQVRVYTIAGMQIDSKEHVRTVKAKALKLLIILGVFVLNFMLGFLDLNIYIKSFVWMFTAIMLYVKRRIVNPLKVVQMYLQILYTLKNRKYLNEDYKVKR